jgi:hypothetical protein
MKGWIVIAAAVLVVGCGGEERLTKAETASRLNGAVGTLNAEFQAIFEQLGQSREGARVPAALRERLARAAEIERRGASELEQLEPVSGSEPAYDDFVRAARAQAERLEEAAAQPDLTVAEMADTIELPAMRDALAELARQGLVEPPGHS